MRFWGVLGLTWEGFGKVLGGFWSLLGPLGLFWALFFSCLYLEWSLKVLLEASGLDFRSILKGLGRIFGGVWEVFGKVLRGI